MKLKKYALILLAVVALTIAAIAVPALATGDSVVYVKAGGTGNGATPDAAMGDLFEAIKALPADGGTVVVCGDLTVTGTNTTHLWTWTAKTGKVTVNGKYNGIDYAPTITFKGTKNVIECASAIEFDNVTLDHRATGGSTEFYAGPSLTFGNNMTFLNSGAEIVTSTNGFITVRLGNYNAACVNSRVEIFSGTLSYVQGANNKKPVTNSTIILHPGVKLTDHLQCSGTGKDVGTGNVTVDGADINVLYINGHGVAKVTESMTISVKNSNINQLLYNRAGSGTPTCAAVDLTLDNTTVGSLCNIDNSLVTGNANLTLKNYTDLTLTNTLSGWDSLTLNNATVLVDAAYAGPATFTADSDSLLIVDDATATVPTGALKESVAVVTVDGTNVADLGAAYTALPEQGGIIRLATDVTVALKLDTEFYAWPGYVYSGTKTGPVTITSADPADPAVLTLQAKRSTRSVISVRQTTKFSNLELRAHQDSSGGIQLFAGPSLTFGNGMTCTTNNGAAIQAADILGVRLGDHNSSFTNRDSKFYMYSGTVNFIHGGNNRCDTKDSTIYVGKDATVVDMIQCGGTYYKEHTTNVASTTVMVDGATVKEIYLNGHGANVTIGTVSVTVRNATVNSIKYHRTTDATATCTTANLVLDNSTVGMIAVKDSRIATGKLTLKNYDHLTVGNELSSWNSVTLDNAIVYVNTAFTDALAVTADSDSKILYDTTTNPDGLTNVTGVATGVLGSAGESTVTPPEKYAQVYLDQSKSLVLGDGSADGSAAKPVSSLADAYAILQDGAATIHLVGEYKITGAPGVYVFPYHNGKVTIVGTDANAKINFDTTDKTLVQFSSATELKNLQWRFAHKVGNMDIYSGPDLSVQEGVSFHCDNHGSIGENCIAIRGGYQKDSYQNAAIANKDVKITVMSGKLSYIQGGNGATVTGSTIINFGGTAEVVDCIQGGGTGKDVNNSTVNISGGKIPKLYINGYGAANMNGDSNITITGGTINNLRAGRSRAQYNDANNAESTGTLGNVTVTIGGTAKVKEIDFWDQNTMTFTGTKKLVMKALAEEFTYNGSFGQWDEVSIEEASAVCYSGTYVAPKSKLVIKDTSKLIVNTCTNNPNNITADEGTGTVTGRHLINYVEAKEVSIAYPGELAHYACPSCGKIYRDADGVNEITDRESIRTYWQCHTDNGSLTGTGDDFSTEMMFTISGGQGIAISGDYMFQCDGSGNCYVYNMLTGRRIGSFKLGSYNNGSIASFESEDWVSDEDRQRYAELQQQLDAAKANGASENELKAIEDKMATIRADYQNHANQIMFSSYYYKDTDVFPLLYVTAGNEGAYGKYGYRGHCAVERIVYDEETGIWSAQCLQRIFFDDRGYTTEAINANNFAFTYQDNATTGFVNSNGYEKIGWGWPASFVDKDPENCVTKDKFYLYSARYRTTTSWESSWANTYAKQGFAGFNYKDHSAYIITEFDMPAPPSVNGEYESLVILSPLDIQDQFTTEYRSYVTQGGTMYQGRIYYSYGWNGAYGTAHADSLQVFDIASKKIISRLDLGEDRNGIGHCEPECVAVWNGKIVMSCNGRNPVPSGLWIFGHIELHGETKPTCTEDGTHYTYCSYCGEHLSDTVKVEDKLDHSFTNYVSDGNATCEADGTKTAVCDRDGCEETHTVADTDSKLDHSFTDYKSNGDATCTADGTKTAKCDRCDETDTVKEAAHGHKLTKVAGKAATCTEEGVVEHYTCSVCKKNFSDAEGKTALSTTVIPSCHSVEKVEGKAATTTENGLKEHYGCASCGKVYADAEGKTEVTKDSLIISATSAPTDTGDDFQAWPFILLMLLSVAGVTVLVIGKKQWFRKNK